MAAPERYSFVELIGGADGTDTCLLLCVGRCGSDALQNREACYAFRCGEGCARLLGANDVSLRHLRATFLNKATDALGAPELFLHCRESGVDMPSIVGDANASRMAAAALRAACPWASDVRIEESYEDDLVRVTRNGEAFMVEVCGRTLVISADAYHDDADVVLHTEASDTQIVNRVVVDYTRQNCKRGFARANALAKERAAFFGAARTSSSDYGPGVLRCYVAPRPHVEECEGDVADDAAAAPADDNGEGPRLTFLGTGSAKPSSRRGESAIIVEWAAASILLDCGAGTLRTITDAALDALDAVWVSHAHWDHFGGLAALVAAAARRRGRSNEDVARMLKRQKRDDAKPPLQVLALARVAAFLRVALDVLGAPASGYAIHAIADQASSIVKRGPLVITSIRVTHCRGAFACIVNCEGEAWAVAYSGDGRPSEHFARKCREEGKLALIHEATFSDDDKAKALATKHSTISEALRMAADANAECCILTHISQRYDGVLDVDDALVAFDGLRVRAASVATLYEASAKCERAVAASAKARREARKLRRWDDHDATNRPDVRGTTAPSPKSSDALEDALRAFYAVHAPQKAKDAPQIAAVFRRDFEAMDDRLFRKYGARLQLPNDASSSSDDSSDDEAEAALAAPGGFAALVGGCGDLPARPVFS
jgi:ribonuclease Z